MTTPPARSRPRRPRRPTRAAAAHPVVVSDPRAITALAHPARLAVLDELMGGRELTATQCASIAGLTPSAMSYHLRALARWGLIERVPSSADGRERPWRAVERGWRIESAQPQLSAAAESTLVATFLDRIRTEVLDAVGRTDDDGGWRDATTISNSFRWLTVDEANQLVEQVRLLTKRAGSRTRTGTDARRIRLSFVVAPSDESR